MRSLGLRTPRRPSRVAGWASLAAFVGTGIYMRIRLPALAAEVDAVRYTLRANHVYLLLAGLLNLALHGVPAPSSALPRVRQRLFVAGLLIAAVSPAILLAAFIIEGPHPSPQRPLTATGLIMLAVAMVLVLLSRPGQRT